MADDKDTSFDVYSKSMAGDNSDASSARRRWGYWVLRPVAVVSRLTAKGLVDKQRSMRASQRTLIDEPTHCIDSPFNLSPSRTETDE